MQLLLRIAAIGFSIATAVLAQEPANPRMNVLFILADDMRTEIASFGSARAKTPHIDKLGMEGVRFDRAYCQYPLCNPSRSSMLTGRYPTTGHVYGNRDWFQGMHPDWISLPRFFKEHGYQTLRTGKVFHGASMTSPVGPREASDTSMAGNLSLPRRRSLSATTRTSGSHVL